MGTFSINTRIFFGRDAIDDLLRFLENRKIAKCAFILDRNVMATEGFESFLKVLRTNGLLVVHFEEINLENEPSYAFLDQVTERFREADIDAVFGVGGGSVLDLAKGVGILLKNPGPALSYRGMDKVEIEGIPVVCIPTTAGTGSEVTHTASFIDLDTKTKLGINGRHVAPVCGLLIPELTFSVPQKVAVSAGLDAMLHAIEAITARTASPITKMLGSQAFTVLFNNFRQAVENSENYEAQANMLLGSYYAGVAMMNAGGGPASGISYPLGVHYGIPHGIAGGIFLPHVFSYNVEMGYNGYTRVYDCLPDADLKLTDDEKSTAFVQEFDKLYSDIGAPPRLKTWGWKEIDIELLTELTMAERKANLELNPVFFGEQEVRNLLAKVV